MDSVREDLELQPVSMNVVEPSAMDLEPRLIPRPKDVLNLLTGIFFKTVYFLDPELSKCLIAGFFKNRGNRLGVVFKGRKGAVFLSYETFNWFAPHFNEITVALGTKDKYVLKGDNFHVRVSNVFGRQHIFLYDGEHTLTLNEFEWTQFTSNLPALYRELRNRFLQEDLIIKYIDDILVSDADFVEPPEGLSPYQSDRLFDEVQHYKRWPNGVNSGD